MSDPEDLVRREAAAAEEAERDSALASSADVGVLLSLGEVAARLERTTAEIEELVRAGQLKAVTVIGRGHSEIRIDSGQLAGFREPGGGEAGEVRRSDGT